MAPWQVGFDTPINGAPYTFTIRVSDVAGRQATLVEPSFMVDLIPPDVQVPMIQFDGITATVGQVITSPVVTATFVVSASDKSGIDHLWYAWTPDPVDPGSDYTGLFTITSPGADLITVTMPLTVPATYGVARYLYVGAGDVWTGYTSRFFGPFYQDPPGTPGYIGMNEPQGPYAGQPYREWMNASSGCTLIGTDKRIPDRAQAGSAINEVQNLYVTWSQPSQRLTTGINGYGTITWDSPKLRLTWTGANWDSDGDLFIYLDTVPSSYLDGSTWVHQGGYVAYNPYTATMSNTVVLLPTQDQVGVPDVDTFDADYAIWVKDSQTAELLQWDNAQSAWLFSRTLPIPGENGEDWGYRFDPNGSDYTDLSIPFEMIGATNLTTGSLGLVAFASEENALRLWSVMPAANPVNSRRVARLAPSSDEPSRFMLTDRYTLQLADGVCQQVTGRFQVEASANPGGLNYSQTDDEMRLLLPRPSIFGYDFWENVFGPYDDLYQTWLDEEYCPTHYWLPVCRPDRSITPEQFVGPLASFRQVEYPPVLPGQVVTYTIRYDNDTPTSYNDAWVRFTSDRPLTWGNKCNLGVIHVGNVPAYSQGSVEMTGTTGMNGLGVITAAWYSWGFDANLDTCSAQVTNPSPVEMFVNHTTDDAAPHYVAIQSPRTVIGAGRVTLRGAVADASPVSTITLQTQGPAGSANVPCVDDTPGDGQWTCEWDVAASNGGVRPTDGDLFRVRVSAADPFGHVSPWSPPLTLTVDTTPPTITLAAALQSTVTLPLLSGAKPDLSGSLSDNRLVDSVEVCDTPSPAQGEGRGEGQSCVPAEMLLDSVGGTGQNLCLRRRTH